jgi:Domain of unknown function (DUF4272)
MNNDQKQQIKLANDARILNAGYKVCDWLPILEIAQLRSLDDIKGRMSVMNALINISFGAPTYIIESWLEKHDLSQHLSTAEKKIVTANDHELTEADFNGLRWYLEGLWALMWATNMIENLEAEQHVGDNQASLMPNLEHDEDNKKIAVINSIRSETEIYTMLDYYYRLHWYCVDERLNSKQTKLDEGIIVERRRALEWIFKRSADWDNVEMST